MVEFIILVSGLDIISAHVFRIFGGILSKPVAAFLLTDLIRLTVFSSVVKGKSNDIDGLISCLIN